MNEKKQHISESMHVNEVFENIFNSVKFSNLNFYLQQIPFAAIISIKKSPIKDKFWAFIQPFPLEWEILNNVKIEKYAIGDRMNLLEFHSFSLQIEVHGEVSSSEESRDTINILSSPRTSLSTSLSRGTWLIEYVTEGSQAGRNSVSYTSTLRRDKGIGTRSFSSGR